MREGFLLVISGPSGVGKGTVCNELLKEEKNIRFSISQLEIGRASCRERV